MDVDEAGMDRKTSKQPGQKGLFGRKRPRFGLGDDENNQRTK